MLAVLLEPILRHMAIAWQHSSWEARNGCQEEAVGAMLRLPDDLWAELVGLLPPPRAPGLPGRPQVPFRQVLDGILYVLRTGCQWKAVPKEFGSGSTCHKRFQEWERAGIFEQFCLSG